MGVLKEFFYIVLIIRIVSSFLPPRGDGLWGRIVGVSIQVTEPVLGPIRRRLPMVGMLDLSPLVAFFLLDVVAYILIAFFDYLAGL